MKPLSMRHFILIKRRSRLNGQHAAPLLKEILNRNSGEPPGFRTASGDRKTCRTKPQNTFICNTINKNDFPFTPPARPWRGKGTLPFPPAPRTPEQPRRFRASPNDTKSSFPEPGRANMQRSSPTPTRRKKKIPPSFIPSKTPPSHGTGKGGAPVAETEN